MGMPPQKHVIDSGATTVASTSQTSLLVAKGIINPDPFTNNYECRAGSIVGAMTVQIDLAIASNVINAGTMLFDWMLFYNINDSQTAPSCEAVMSSAGADLISQIIHQDGTLITNPNSLSTADANVRSWRLNIAIPRTWSKLNRGDTIRLYFKNSIANSMTIKIRVIYKEYFP